MKLGGVVPTSMMTAKQKTNFEKLWQTLKCSVTEAGKSRTIGCSEAFRCLRSLQKTFRKSVVSSSVVIIFLPCRIRHGLKSTVGCEAKTFTGCRIRLA